MAKRIAVNIGMVEALKKMLRSDFCSRCGQEWSYHAWFDTKGNDSTDIVRCSNIDQKR